MDIPVFSLLMERRRLDDPEEREIIARCGGVPVFVSDVSVLKELTGFSAARFMQNIRMQQAMKLLKEKRVNVSQIAYSVGFASQTHFSTTFKQYYGVSPTEYIRQLEADESKN